MELVARRAVALVSEFVEWWLGELAALVPVPLRRLLSNRRRRLVLSLGESSGTLLHEADGMAAELGRFPLADEATAAAALATLLATIGIAGSPRGGSTETCLRFSSEQCLNTVMRLPLEARGNLDEVVTFELDHQTPFRPAQVLFSANISREDVATGLLDVPVTLILRSSVDAAIARAERLGFVPTRIDVAAPDGSGAATGNLLENGGPESIRHTNKRSVVGLSAGAVILAAAAVALPIALAQRTDDELTARFAAVKRTASGIAQMQKEIDELRRTQLLLIDMRHSSPTATQLLFDTTHVLPDDAWLASWKVTGDEVEIQGVAKSAASLVSVLEHSGMFERSAFLSPVTQEPNGGERFNIATHIASRGHP